MSLKSVRQVWESAQVEDTELLLLLAIAYHVNDHGIAYPGVPTLARFIRKSDRTVKRLVRKLELEGYLTVGYRLGPKGTNVYRITPVPHDRAVSHDKAMTPGVTEEGKSLGDTQMSPDLLNSEMRKLAKEYWTPGSEPWKVIVGQAMLQKQNGEASHGLTDSPSIVE